jgi:hypothetical protein
MLRGGEGGELRAAFHHFEDVLRRRGAGAPSTLLVVQVLETLDYL